MKDKTEDKDFFGKLVFTTIHLERWLKEINTQFSIPMANRIARVIKVFDWESEEGKLLLDAREKTGKWASLDPKEFKFVLKIYYPDINHKTKEGITVEEVVPRYIPKSKLEMFHEVPDWMLSELKNEKIKEFSLVRKTESKEVSKHKVSADRPKVKVTKSNKTPLNKKVIAVKVPRK